MPLPWVQRKDTPAWCRSWWGIHMTRHSNQRYLLPWKGLLSSPIPVPIVRLHALVSSGVATTKLHRSHCRQRELPRRPLPPFWWEVAHNQVLQHAYQLLPWSALLSVVSSVPTAIETRGYTTTTHLFFLCFRGVLCAGLTQWDWKQAPGLGHVPLA